MGRDPGFETERASGPAGGAQPTGEALLGVVAQLMRDSQPAATRLAPPALDSSLERDLAIDSLARVELLMRIERAFDVRLPEHMLAAAETPGDLLRAVLAGTRAAAEPPMAAPPVQPGGESVRVPAGAATLLDALDWHVQHHPDRRHLVILGDDDAGEPVTYAQLRAQALPVAAGLARRGLGSGQAVAIMLPTSRDFFRAFVGILLAGCVPVPIYPPLRWAQVGEHLQRQAAILDNCRAAILVTMAEGKPFARALQGRAPSLADIATVDELASAGVPGALPAVKASDLALLQYTSGSTGDPKGVMLTHANLLANIRAMGEAVAAGPADVFVSWLPLYHDMGLIGAWMGGLYHAFPLVLMPPTAFLNRPSRWLRAVHRHGGTLSSAPNFAYEICATRVDERDLAGLDLSSWRLAFNGAEPVSPDTLARFGQRFGRYGLRREAMTPVYGLAECAVGLAFPPLGRGPRIDRVARSELTASRHAVPAGEDDATALRYLGCGMPLKGHEIRVVGPAGRELPERMEGRIQFRGPSATAGYYRNAPRTRELFDGDWLDTGDLGYTADGELFVTSREKDVIIRGGQHIHPYELEEAVGAIAGVRKGCVAVFGVPDPASGTERVVVMAESRLEAIAARETLRAAIAAAALALLGTPADEIVIVAPHTVLKTSSGKIRRAASREAYLRGVPRAARLAAWRNLAAFVASLLAARARAAARSARQLAYGAYAWSALGLLGAAALPVGLLPPRARWVTMRSLTRMLLGASRLRLSVRGLENVPREGPAVIVANHASYIDGPLLFALLPRPVRFVAKRELAANPVVRLLLRAAGVAFIERFDVERSAADARLLAERARAGEALVFFAEGTFTRAPGLLPFHMGAFVVAAESGAPVIATTLRGTRSVMRDGTWLPRRGAVLVSVGAPRLAEGRDWGAAARLREAARSEILCACGEPDLAARAPFAGDLP